MSSCIKNAAVLKTQLYTTLERVFGHSEFRPGQLDAAVNAMHGRDVFVQMCTGAGKTLCMFLPPLAMSESSIGILSCCPTVLLSCWSAGLLVFCPTVLLSCWFAVLLVCWSADLLVCWSSVLLVCWSAVLLSCCPTVLLSCCPAGLLSYWCV